MGAAETYPAPRVPSAQRHQGGAARVGMSRASKASAGLDSAAWAALLTQTGYATDGRDGPLLHPAGTPALYQHRGRDGRVWFAAQRADWLQFDPALWRRVAAPRKAERRADRIALVPHGGCEAAALRWLAGLQTDDDAALRLTRRTDLDAALRAALLAARTGQGEFRHALEQHESACRVTGLLDRRHLRAVHMMPWRVCDDAQMLDGHNGLLLSPHVAHLFETGGLTFEPQGQLQWSRHLNPAVVKSWRLPTAVKAVEFDAVQQRYLAWHRLHVFEVERLPWPRAAGA